MFCAGVCVSRAILYYISTLFKVKREKKRKKIEKMKIEITFFAASARTKTS